MNKWECEHPGCKRSCIGIGGAVGLIAIGWYFKPGKGIALSAQIYCPEHRPDIDYDGAYKEVKILQQLIRTFHE